MRTRVLAVVVGVLVVALVAVTTVAVLRTRDLRQARERVTELTAQVGDLEEQVSELRTPEPDEAATEEDPAPLEDLPGGDGGLLGSLGGEVPGAACLTQEMTGGGLDSLFGSGDQAPDEPQALVDHIAAEVEEIRQLRLGADVDAELLPAEQMAERLAELSLEDYPPRQAETDRRLLVSLGVLSPDTDLRALLRGLLGAQVAGFYVPETDELVVRTAGGDGLGAVDQIVLAHELEHALADQALGIPDPEPRPADSDGQLAALAVVEGDASLVMNLWALRNLSLADQLGLAFDPTLLTAQEGVEEAPHFLAAQLLFPYLDGLGFVCEVFRDGGWGAVDRLYEDPPESSAQVMEPERYLADDEPDAAQSLSAPGGWRERTTDTFGAAPLAWLFEAPGDVPDRALSEPERRARVWAGGRVTVWERDAATAVGMSLVDGGGGPPLCTSVRDWYAAAFPAAEQDGEGPTTSFDGSDQDAVLRCGEGTVALGIAPDLETARSVAG